LRASATASRASVLWALRSVPFGNTAATAIGIFVRAALPRAVRVAEIDVQAVSIFSRACCTSPPPDPRSATSELLRQAGDRARDAVADCSAHARPAQARSSRERLRRAPPSAQVQQHREPRRASTSVPIAELSNPRMRSPSSARHYPISDLRWALADHDLGTNERLAPSAGSRPWHAQCPPSAQTGVSSRRRAPRLARKATGKWLVLMRIVSSCGSRAVSDGNLLRLHAEPTADPADVRSATFPGHRRTGNRSPTRRYDHAG